MISISKKVLSRGIVVLFIGLFIAYKMYNKPHVNVADTKAKFSVQATTITSEFSQDEDEANAKYLEKIVQVSGALKSIKNEEGKVILSLGNEDDMESVMCHLLPSESDKVQKLEVGKNVIVKGICTGYLLDVILVNGVITN